ncbi:MAG: glycosyltransferase family 2 protein [Chloroflexi bacterium]|nr:glycosyltransferase family 2 protein [Chloroflexota bacterium]
MASEAAMDLSIVVVSWNVRTLLEACLRSVYASLAAAPLAGEVIVVDSASADGSAEMVRERYPQALLLAQDENIGFVRANNLGIRRSRGQHILLLNPDTEVVGGALAALWEYLRAHPEVGIVGPKLLNPDGSVQPSRRRFPTLATAFIESTVLQQWFPKHPLLRRYYVSDRSDDETQEVDWVTGACFLVRREAFAGVGLLDEALFMYSEELDWAYRIKGAGWRVAYLPAAQVIHHGGQSSSQVVAAQHIYFQSSKVHFFRKHHGAAAGEALRWFLLGTYAYQWLREGLKWLIGHKRSMRAPRLRTYEQVMRSGLKSAGRIS